AAQEMKKQKRFSALCIRRGNQPAWRVAKSVYRKWKHTAQFFQSQAQRRPLEFIRYRGPNEKLGTVADEPV
ncbi:MAG: hypothetical protein ACREUI_08585, partial [Burkholderiales bacterium]